MISFFANYSFYARVNYHHGTGSARRHFAEKCRSLKWYPKLCCLDDRVLFRMERAYAVLGYVAVAVEDFAHVVTNLVAMRQTSRCTNVPGGHNSFVFDNYAATSSTVTCCPLSHCFAQVQEILIPVGSRMIILQEPSPSKQFQRNIFRTN
jgi:hypothetical protein